MGFKAATKAAPPASRNRATDPEMVKLVEQLLSGDLPAIVATGDEKKKGKEREKTARADASKVAHYIRTKHEDAGKVRTIWVADEQSVYVELAKAESNGNGSESDDNDESEDESTESESENV